MQKPFLIDTHAHLYLEDYKNDYKEVINRALEKNIWVIIPGLDLTTSQKAIEIADKFESGVYAAVGLHPENILEELAGREEIDIDAFRKLVKHPKVVAFGEVGLDYFHLKRLAAKHNVKPEYYLDLQKKILKEFINLSQDSRLPLILHCRDDSFFIKEKDPARAKALIQRGQGAHRDLIDILYEFNTASKGFDTRGVVHCYSGDWEQAVRYLNMNFDISFTGVITFPKYKEIEIIKKLPITKILVETDSPFLAPVPFRGKRNEPAYVEYVAQKIAQIKNEDLSKTAEILTDNAIRLFKLDQKR